MQTTATSLSGYIQINGLCITVKELAVTLENCVSQDGPDLATQFFVAAHDKGGPYLKFVGGPPKSTEKIGFVIDDNDPQGLIAAVKGAGKVVLGIDPDSN